MVAWVARSVWNVASGRFAVAATRTALSLRSESLALIRRRAAGGLVSDLDVAQAEGARAELEASRAATREAAAGIAVEVEVLANPLLDFITQQKQMVVATTFASNIARLKTLAEAGVAASPGVDFDRVNGGRYVRFSYAGSRETMHKALERMQRFLKA